MYSIFQNLFITVDVLFVIHYNTFYATTIHIKSFITNKFINGEDPFLSQNHSFSRDCLKVNLINYLEGMFPKNIRTSKFCLCFSINEMKPVADLRKVSYVILIVILQVILEILLAPIFYSELVTQVFLAALFLLIIKSTRYLMYQVSFSSNVIVKLRSRSNHRMIC